MSDVHLRTHSMPGRLLLGLQVAAVLWLRCRFFIGLQSHLGLQGLMVNMIIAAPLKHLVNAVYIVFFPIYIFLLNCIVLCIGGKGVVTEN